MYDFKKKKKKVGGIEGDGEGLNWFLREAKIFGGVRS